MKALALYPAPPRYAVEDERGEDVTTRCKRCKLHQGVTSVCLAPEGDPGGLLIIGDAPTKDEDARGRPFVGQASALVRKAVKMFWSGPVAYDYAVKCSPGGRGIGDREIEACRTYLAGVVAEVRPTRIIILGAHAAQALLGRSLSPHGTRRGVAWLSSLRDVDPIPVVALHAPGLAARNRFVRRWFEEDMAWACGDLSAIAEAAYVGGELPAVPPPYRTHRAHLVVSAADARAAIAEVRAAKWGAWDVETTGAQFTSLFRVLCAAVCPEGAKDVFVWTAEALAKESPALAELLAWLADPSAPKLGQNEKYDRLSIFSAFGVMPRGCAGDTRLWRKILDPEGNGKLAAMADLVGYGGHKGEAEVAKEDAVELVRRAFAAERRDAKSKNLSFSFARPERIVPAADAALDAVIRGNPQDTDRWVYGLIPKPVLYRYNARDALVTARLGERLGAQLDASPLRRVWDDLVGPAASAVAHVEAWGIACSRDALEAFDQHLEVQIANVARKLEPYGDVNWNSPDQVADLLFNRLGLKSLEKTDTGKDSTGEEVLEKLAKQHPLPGILLDHRGLTKMRGAFAQGLLPHIRDDGRIHPNLKLDGAATGRLSCRDPNLQQIPRAQSVEGKMARDVFSAPPGHVIVQLDYSQLELRIAAARSGDADMLAIFAEGVDYHQRTAELIARSAWGIEPSQVTKVHRSGAKVVNFGLLYGKGDPTLAKDLNCTIADARRIREAVLGHFKTLARWCDARVSEARRSGETWTHWKGAPFRRRSLWRIGDADSESRSRAEHGAVNTPIQGEASDYGLASLAAAVEWIHEDAVPAKLVLAVHDSLLFETRIDAVDEVVEQGRRIMTSWPCDCPLVVDAEVGPSWGSLVSYESWQKNRAA